MLSVLARIEELAFRLLYGPVSQRGATSFQLTMNGTEATAMTTLAAKLWADEAGFIVSAELVLVSTILVLSMVVGMSEVAFAVNQELEDVASAFGSVNQSYRYAGLFDDGKAVTSGSRFHDHSDDCDSQWDIAGAGVRPESY
jgi:hypothetical protein